MGSWTQADVDAINAKRGATLPAHFPPGALAKRHKYGAQATEDGGRRFDSKKEARRYQELTIMERSGLIQQLVVQPHYALFVPAFHGTAALVNVNDAKIVGTRIVAEYHADFSYRQDGAIVVEDVKSPATRTPIYQLKKRMFEAQYGVTIRET